MSPLIIEISYINVLVVADGIVHFGPKDESDATFTLSHFLAALAAHQVPKIQIQTAHRRADANADFPQFNFVSSVNLNDFDEIWLFGYEGSNEGTIAPGTSAIGAAEIAAIASFMDNGGGVFAAGDHGGLGSFMCGLIPRVRSMRKWFDPDNTVPAGYPANWPGSGQDRIDTTQVDSNNQYWFDNQSDDLPQPLTIPGGLSAAHPILRNQNGVLVQFPDHMHEGEVITPWTLAETLTYDGQFFVEYPTLNGLQEQPEIIAIGKVIGNHTTPLEGNDSSEFQGSYVDANAKVFNVLCAYDGRKMKVGRVVTDSSFHHELDLNLTGDPLGVGNKQLGFTTPAGQPILDALDAFYVNTAIWLARSVHFWFIIDILLRRPWWWELVDPGGPVEDGGLAKILQYGVLIRQELSRNVSDAIVVEWVHEALADIGLGELLPAPRRRQTSERGIASRYGDDIIAAVLGGTVLEMMRMRSGAQAISLGLEGAQRAARNGMAVGLRALGRGIEARNRESAGLAAMLLSAHSGRSSVT